METLKKVTRNADGLIEGLEYHFNEDGSVNWRKMIRPEFLAPNRDKTTETDVTKLQDKDLVILLSGIRSLAAIRGVTSVKYSTPAAAPHYVCTVCEMSFTPNYETEGNAVTFSSQADAHPDNTNGFGRNYLAAIAENRAFARCVRNFLKISIVSQEELGAKAEESKIQSNSPFEPHAVLAQVMNEKKVTFEKVKAALIKDSVAGAENFVNINDIPKAQVLDLIERISSKMK